MTPPKSPMSDDHKAALAQGRRQGAAIRAYIEALENNKPKRGRKRTLESVQTKLQETEAAIGSASGIDRLELMQTRRDLERELAAGDTSIDLSALEAEFITLASEYSERKGIEYATWREFGVSAATLKAASISRKG
jgi:hypothetical protein